MAISTPAQKPRGAASSTRSTAMAPSATGAPRGRVAGGRPRSLGPMSAPRVVAVAPGSPAATRRAASSATRSLAIDGQVPRDIIEWRFLVDEPDLGARGAPGRPRADRRGGQGGRASRSGVEVHSALFDQVRTCDNHCEFCFIYQLPPGLRKSLYLKDDDYRLSLPLRELHHPHPLHRGRPRAGGHRGAVARSTCQHPRHRPRRAHATCCATGGAPPACAGCGPCSTTASRCTARSWCARASTTAPCSTTRWPACSTSTPSWPRCASCPLGRQPLQHRARACGPTPRPRPAAVVDAVRRLAGRLPRASSAAASCSPPTSTTCWPAGPFPAAEAYEGFPMHEDGVGMARTFELEFTGDAPTPRPASQRRLLRLGRRRRRAEGYRAPTRPSRGTGPPARPAAPCARRAGAPVGILTGALRRRRCSARSSTRLDRDDVRVVPVRQRVLRRQHRRHRPAGRRRPGPGAGRPSPTATATCCPTCACPTAASSTAPRRPTCPARSRSSPPTASPCAEPWTARERADERAARSSPSSAAPTSASPRWSTASWAPRGASSRRSPASPATARRSRPSGWACPSRSSTPAAGCPAGSELDDKVSRQSRAGRARAPTSCCSWSTPPWGHRGGRRGRRVAAARRQAGAPGGQQGRRRPPRERDRGSSSRLGLGDPYPVERAARPAAPATCSTPCSAVLPEDARAVDDADRRCDDDGELESR